MKKQLGLMLIMSTMALGATAELEMIYNVPETLDIAFVEKGTSGEDQVPINSLDLTGADLAEVDLSINSNKLGGNGNIEVEYVVYNDVIESGGSFDLVNFENTESRIPVTFEYTDIQNALSDGSGQEKYKKQELKFMPTEDGSQTFGVHNNTLQVTVTTK